MPSDGGLFILEGVWVWKQGEGQIQYMDQNEGRGLFFFNYKTKSDI